ncbi:choice-of-anchor A family protein [Streptacidiphilus sp. MAP12-33]|uniref:choice-of-anchor A family protein n=1 Tax=Streptacidiphilus sp. MAP12-33 TaxID=3156266 RepID=UPI003511D0DD
MRHTLPAAVVLGGSLALATLVTPVTASASTSPSCGNPLGAAAGYTEFVAGDSQRTADAEGAVAVGGNADLTHGFSLGAKLSPAQAAALPGGAALVVGGTLDLGTANVEVMRGNAVYGALQGSAHLWMNGGGQAAQGASPIDFARSFTALRATSARLAALPATGTATLHQDGANAVLTLTGTAARLNVFTLTAQQLQAAGEIRIDVPAGSSTVVTVTGTSYDMNTGGTSAVLLKDPTTGGWHEDDYTEPDAALTGIRGGLLWNFPDATGVVKRDGTAWPGTLLAPNAAVHLGSGNLNGEVVAASLTSAGGAETHHFSYSGCVPGTSTPSGSPSHSPTPSPSAPSSSPSPSHPGTPTPTSSQPTGTGGTGSTTGGSLAHTGGGDDTTPLLGAGAAVIVLGAGTVALTRRRRPGSTSR